nr:MAG TPA: hypothetical protein [Caudoviricetes sp.]
MYKKLVKSSFFILKGDNRVIISTKNKGAFNCSL